MRLRVGTVLVSCAALAWAEAGEAQSLSTYGTPGLVELPTAEVLKPEELAFTTSHFGPNQRYALTFQVLPRITGTFRYSIVDGFNGPIIGDRFDRSFDIHFQIADETDSRPALAFGLRDFIGTGIYSSEYFVATKHLTPRLKFTGGIGWGRLAGVGSFSNPFSIVSDRFDTRPGRGSNTGGQIELGNWFRGPAALFGGVEWQATERTSLFLEYSSDAYSEEISRPLTDIDIKTPLNFGISHRFKNGLNMKGFVIGGSEVGLQFSYILDPAKRRAPGGQDKAPLVIVPRNAAVLASWGLNDAAPKANAKNNLAKLLSQEGIELQGFSTDGSRASIQVENNRWDIEAQAVGRTARAMSQVLPASVDTFVITLQTGGVPNSKVTLNRDSLYELETDFDGAWKSLSRARIEDGASVDRSGELAESYPKFSFGLGPYTAFSLFDPDSPVRYDVGLELALGYAPRPGLSFSGVFRQPLYGNIADAKRVSNSVIQRVRTDAVRYAQESDFEINRLTADYVWRPSDDLFARVSVGYLEDMYGGVSGELLWYPIASRLALGVEANYVKQRDFDMLLGFQNYSVLTGHASAYYDLGNGFTTQLDVGRYLAGDWGATVSVDREFNNGFKVGGYFTLTDVSFDDFGEGSFDKGIRISIPLSWLTGKPTRATVDQTIQPILRDGGARLNIANRLYPSTRDYRGSKLSSGWARFYR